MDDEKYVISINLPIAKGSLIDEIKALPKITAPPKKKKFFDEEQSEPLILSSVTGKKKKDKKKKKKSLLEDSNFMSAGRLGTELNEDDEFSAIIAQDNLIDIDEILNRDDDEDGLSDPIIDEQRRGYEKRKKDENPFKKEFAEELTLLYDLLDEMNRLSKELDKKYKTLEGSKVRGVSKYTNDHVINMLSAKSSKLQIIKEINSLKKTIADLKIKADAKKKDVEGAQSTDMLATQYFQNVLKYGRGNFLRDFGGPAGGQTELDDEIDDIVNQVELNKSGYTSDEVDMYQQAIEERLSASTNPFRTEDGTRYIEFENRGPKIHIKKCVDTGEWEFVCLDRDNQVIHGYPLPKKREVGKVKFADGFASDSLGRTYKVIEYYSPDYED
jgi:hypothetical protein